MSAQSDALTLALNNLAHTSLCNFVAEKVKAENGVINLLTLYNETLGSGNEITAETALHSKEFYRFAGMIMRNYMDYMTQPSKLYNTEGLLRATARDNMHVLISSDFFSGYETYLSSDTFHDSIVKLPLFKKYISLQGTGTTAPNFVENTTIKVNPSSNGENDEPITVEGVVGMFIDRQAIGTTYRDVYTGTDRNNRNRYTNFTSMCTLGMYNDLSESAIIFLVADEGE